MNEDKANEQATSPQQENDRTRMPMLDPELIREIDESTSKLNILPALTHSQAMEISEVLGDYAGKDSLQDIYFTGAVAMLYVLDGFRRSGDDFSAHRIVRSIRRAYAKDLFDILAMATNRTSSEFGEVLVKEVPLGKPSNQGE